MWPFQRFSPPCKSLFIFLEILSPLQISFYFSWDSLPLANLIFKWPHLGFLSLFNFHLILHLHHTFLPWMQYTFWCLMCAFHECKMNVHACVYICTSCTRLNGLHFTSVNLHNQSSHYIFISLSQYNTTSSGLQISTYHHSFIFHYIHIYIYSYNKHKLTTIYSYKRRTTSKHWINNYLP